MNICTVDIGIPFSHCANCAAIRVRIPPQRFRPISVERPKVLMPLVNAPMLDYTLEWLAYAGVEEVTARAWAILITSVVLWAPAEAPPRKLRTHINRLFVRVVFRRCSSSVVRTPHRLRPISSPRSGPPCPTSQ